MKRDFIKWEVLTAAPLVKECEGLRLEAYICPAGVATIGYGHTAGVKLGTRITQADADRMLTLDLEKIKRRAASYILVPVTQGQFKALTSLIYNIGDLRKKAPKLLAYLNAGNTQAAAKEFLDIGSIKKRDAQGNVIYDEAGKVVYVQSRGLALRRKKEMEAFLS